MVRERKNWHHRVPDFQLVYCGPNKNVTKKQKKSIQAKTSVKLSIISNKCQISNKPSKERT